MIFSGSSEFQPEVVPINEFLDEELRRAHLPSQVRVVREFDSSNPDVNIDECQIMELVNEAMEKASETMSEGGTLTVGTSVTEGRVLVVIKGTVSGIISDAIEKAFLSLAADEDARAIIDRHKAKVEVTRMERGGSTFAFDLPVVPIKLLPQGGTTIERVRAFRLEDSLRRFDKQQDGARAVFAEIESETARFLTDFASCRESKIRPMMESIGEQLRAAGHGYRIDPFEPGNEEERRYRDTITLALLPKQLRHFGRGVFATPSVSYIADAITRRICVVGCPLLSGDESVPRFIPNTSQTYDLGTLQNIHNIERHIVDALDYVFSSADLTPQEAKERKRRLMGIELLPSWIEVELRTALQDAESRFPVGKINQAAENAFREKGGFLEGQQVREILRRILEEYGVPAAERLTIADKIADWWSELIADKRWP